MLAQTVDAVIGIDTHRDTHQVEIATPTGAVIATSTISNSGVGFTELLTWIAEHSPGPRLVAAVEGTRSYGIGVARVLSAAGMTVIEAEQPARKDRRGKGKSDPIDAHLAVLFALRQNPSRLPVPRADGARESLRILLGARHDLVTTSTAQTNRLKALLLAGADADRDLARTRFTDTVLASLARRRLPTGADRDHAIRHNEIRRLTLALRTAGKDLRDNKKVLHNLVAELAPWLTDRPGIGPVSAAQVLVSYSHPGRVRNDAAFAALAGTAPLEASSGRTVRHRLNRGGDRALNRAIHTITLTRMRSDEKTRAYVERRRAHGKTDREIRRCLKRYITRELYRTLTPPAAA
jgi:transposase